MLDDLQLDGKRIWVAGHRGMVGSALVRRLAGEGCEVLTVGRETCDLADQAQVRGWMREARPDMVIVAAARVGGILANMTYPVDFLRDNLLIETNVIDGAHAVGVEKLVFLGSSCIYPRDAAQPITEEALLTGPRWRQPTSGTRSPRSPASGCARPIANNTAAILSRQCRPISTVRTTTSICSRAMSSPR